VDRWSAWRDGLVLAVIAGVAFAMAGCSGYTEPALHVTATSAQLNAKGGCSNTAGHHCYYYWRWGKNGRFTRRTAVHGPVGNTNGRRQIKITLKGLAPDTTYQYQLCGMGDGVKVYRCVGPNGKAGSSSRFTTNRMLWGFAAMGNQFSGSGSSEGPPWDMDAVSRFESTDAGGKGVSVIGWGSPFYSDGWCGGYCAFTTSIYQTVRESGAIPFISWSSVQHDGTGGAPGYTDADIAGGSQDSYITQWARAAARWGHPFFIRFDWEMNGNWWPWNGHWENSPANFVAMWHHVHDIFVANGATNATWVWCPNVDPSNRYQPVSSLYPGNGYVDWTCVDAYNSGKPWVDFSRLVSSTYSAIQRVAPNKPMLVGEVGSVENANDDDAKANWINSLFVELPNDFPAIRGLLWYENLGDDGEDWPIESSQRSIGAFASDIADHAYQTSAFSSLDTTTVQAP
jgi:hypothetical protein